MSSLYGRSTNFQPTHERAWLQGAMISTIAYGINITLFILAFNLLRCRSRLESEKNSRQTAFIQAYAFILVILCTLSAIGQLDVTQLAFIDHRDFPGGPSAYEGEMFSALPVRIMDLVSFTLMNCMVDCLLLWRCLVIYRNSSATLPYLLVFPGMLVLASFATGVVFLNRITGVLSPFTTHVSTTLVYATMCLSLKIILTFIIVVRLSLYRIRIMKLVGLRYAEQYTSITSIFIESGFIMDLAIIATLILFVIQSPFIAVPLSSLIQVQGIASFMIIFRVARGTAWSFGTADELEIVKQGGPRVEDRMLPRFRVTSQMTEISTTVRFNHNSQSIGAARPTQQDNQNPNEKPGDVESICPIEEGEGVRSIEV